MPFFHTGVGSTRISALTTRSGAGGSLLHRIQNLPLDVATPGPRATTVLLLLVVTAFLCLRSPLMILVLPTLTWRFISTNQNFWGQAYHYDLVLMPIVFAALTDGVLAARRSRGGRWLCTVERPRPSPWSSGCCSARPHSSAPWSILRPTGPPHEPRPAAGSRRRFPTTRRSRPIMA